MNTLEKIIFDAINNNDVWTDGGDILDISLTTNITTIAIEFAVSFLVWATTKGIMKDSKKEYWYCESNGLYYTTEQLIENYLQTLK